MLFQYCKNIYYVACFCRYTAEEDFVNADAVFDCIGDPPEIRFDLGFCADLLQKQYVSWNKNLQIKIKPFTVQGSVIHMCIW